MDEFFQNICLVIRKVKGFDFLPNEFLIENSNTLIGSSLKALKLINNYRPRRAKEQTSMNFK